MYWFICQQNVCSFPFFWEQRCFISQFAQFLGNDQANHIRVNDFAFAADNTLNIKKKSLFILYNIPNALFFIFSLIYSRYLDVWMIVVFVYPFIIMTLHTVLQVIYKKKGKNGRIQQALLTFGQIILPIVFTIFCGIFYYVGYFYTTKLQEMKQAPFNKW